MAKHIKPTIEQKIAIYEKALVEIVDESSTGLCNALSTAQRELGMAIDEGWGYMLHFSISDPYNNKGNNMKVNFPEIAKHKPEDKEFGEFWWDSYPYQSDDERTGKQIRINILETEIAKLKKKL